MWSWHQKLCLRDNAGSGGGCFDNARGRVRTESHKWIGRTSHLCPGGLKQQNSRMGLDHEYKIFNFTP